MGAQFLSQAKTNLEDSNRDPKGTKCLYYTVRTIMSWNNYNL